MNTDAHQIVNDWLERLNPSDRGLILDPHGQCQIAAGDGSLYTIFVPDRDSALFYLYAYVWEISGNLDAPIYEELLALNLLGMKTRGGILGLDKQLRSMVFSYSRDIAATDIGMFCTVLDNFSAAAAEIKKCLGAIFRPNTPNRGPKPAPHRRFR